MYPPPPLPDFPSSPSSAWSCSRSPSTPPADLQLDEMFSVQHPILFPKSDPYFLSEDDIQLFLSNRGRWGNMYDRFESTPPCSRFLSRDRTSDDYSWEATHSAIIDPAELADPSRCSLLIHEVSLLVGLAPDDDCSSPNDACLLVPDRPKQAPDALPPTRSLTPRKQRHTALPCHVDAGALVSPFNASSSALNQRSDDSRSALRNAPSATSADLMTPFARHKPNKEIHPSLSPRRRQGQVFESSFNDTSHRNAFDPDDTFTRPREPPPRPTPNHVANRCSSLDRLERSLLKLEAHAPHNHRKSQSEERSPRIPAKSLDKRPSLPPPRRLKKEQPRCETIQPNPSRHGYCCHPLDPPLTIPRPARSRITPLACPADLQNDHVTPGSFMDMDIPCKDETSQKRYFTGKERMKSFVRVAKTASRGVIAWGRTLTGSTKPHVAMQETVTIQNSRT